MGNYALQITWSVVGCFMTAFGVFLQVKASFLTLPGEGINLAISRVTKIAFPKVKVAFDCTNGLSLPQFRWHALALCTACARYHPQQHWQ